MILQNSQSLENKIKMVNILKNIFFVVAFLCTMNFCEKSFAQSYDTPIRKCYSKYCTDVYAKVRSGYFNTSRKSAGTLDEKNQCYNDDMIVGTKISNTNRYIDLQDEKYGGPMKHNRANQMRLLIFNETYGIRSKIQELVYYGDVSKCHSARDATLKIIDSIVQQW